MEEEGKSMNGKDRMMVDKGKAKNGRTRDGKEGREG